MKKIFCLIICIFCITGCGKEEDKVELKTFNCSLNVTEKEQGYNSKAEYTVYHDGDFIDHIDIVETITSKDTAILNSVKDNIEAIYEPLVQKYGGYSYKVTRDNGKIVSRVTIDYTKLDVTMYLRDNPLQEQYFIGDKLPIEGILEIYNSLGIGCDYE